MFSHARMSVAFAGAFLLSQAAVSQELLTNPGIEVTSSPPGWLLEEFWSNPSLTIPANSATQIGFANQELDGEIGLWLRPFIGDFGALSGELSNAILSQTVPGVAGQMYTFSGYSQFEGNFSGGVPLLDPLSSLGEIPSPTQVLFDLEFLDGGGSVISSESLNVAAEQFNGFGWAQHTVSGTAPAGTTEVRVVASGLDMAPNINPGQSAFLDTFSLTTSGNPGSELLTNANMEIDAGEPAGWERLIGEGETARYEQFAARTGNNGFWIAPRSADVSPSDAEFGQTVAATEGAEYSLSGWAFFEPSYSGFVDTLNADSNWGAIPSDTETYFYIEFLDGNGVMIEETLLDLRTVQTTSGIWLEHNLSAVAPAGAEEVRVGVRAESLRFNRVPPGSGPFDDAYFDDFSLTIGLPGDFNGDGVVDAADYTVWRDGLGTLFTPGDYNVWANNYGMTAPSTSQAAPEPSAVLLLLLGSLSSCFRRRVGKD